MNQSLKEILNIWNNQEPIILKKQNNLNITRDKIFDMNHLPVSCEWIFLNCSFFEESVEYRGSTMAIFINCKIIPFISRTPTCKMLAICSEIDIFTPMDAENNYITMIECNIMNSSYDSPMLLGWTTLLYDCNFLGDNKICYEALIGKNENIYPGKFHEKDFEYKFFRINAPSFFFRVHHSVNTGIPTVEIIENSNFNLNLINELMVIISSSFKKIKYIENIAIYKTISSYLIIEIKNELIIIVCGDNSFSLVERSLNYQEGTLHLPGSFLYKKLSE